LFRPERKSKFIQDYSESEYSILMARISNNIIIFGEVQRFLTLKVAYEKRENSQESKT